MLQRPCRTLVEGPWGAERRPSLSGCLAAGAGSPWPAQGPSGWGSRGRGWPAGILCSSSQAALPLHCPRPPSPDENQGADFSPGGCVQGHPGPTPLAEAGQRLSGMAAGQSPTDALGSQGLRGSPPSQAPEGCPAAAGPAQDGPRSERPPGRSCPGLLSTGSLGAMGSEPARGLPPPIPEKGSGPSPGQGSPAAGQGSAYPAGWRPPPHSRGGCASGPRSRPAHAPSARRSGPRGWPGTGTSGRGAPRWGSLSCSPAWPGKGGG